MLGDHDIGKIRAGMAGRKALQGTGHLIDPGRMAQHATCAGACHAHAMP